MLIPDGLQSLFGAKKAKPTSANIPSKAFSAHVHVIVAQKGLFAQSFSFLLKVHVG
jgi:hypothetical protein